jgi:tetratricopeptide (TPR) repeat protein
VARTEALEWHVDAELRLGRYEGLVARLTALIEEHPLNEAFAVQLMRVLQLTGRRAQALDVFQSLRRRLIDELGIEPGTAARQAQQEVLAPETPAPATVPPAAPTPPRTETPRADLTALVPRQLPPAARHFVGRPAELAALDDASGCGEVSVVTGMGGMGKTTLALHWAHQVTARYPDGQLFVDLRGFDARSRSLSGHEACAILLESLGVASLAVPSDPDARVALYRTVVAGRRLLIVLDNAWDEAQVRPLIPGTSGSQVVVTSRNRLAGLVAADGARPVELAPFSVSSSVELLARRAGTLADTDADDAAALAEACGGLPLALTVAATRLRLDPGLRWSALTEQVRDRRAALAVLDVGDENASVRAVLSLSYQRLTDRAASLFRLLDVHPGPDVSLAAATALADDDAVARPLEDLVSASLLARYAGRFRFHDLVRTYATSVASEEPSDARAAARARIYDHYLRSGLAADRLLLPTREPITPPEAVPGSRPTSFADEPAAWAWFETERDALMAVITMAAESGDDDYAHLLPWTLTTYLKRRGDWRALAEVHLLAADAAERAGDLRARARTHNDAGGFLLQIGDYDAALEHLEPAAELWRELGDLKGAWMSENNMGHLHHSQGRHREAADHARKALELARAYGWEPDIALAISTAAWSLAYCGDHKGARALAVEAVALQRRLGDRNGQAHAHDAVGLASFGLGEFPEALEAYEKALELFRESSDVRYQARVLTRIAQTHQAAGRFEAARAAWTEALVLFRQAGAPEAQDIQEMLEGSS